jgi:large subunit ribosomal protein L23Ae
VKQGKHGAAKRKVWTQTTFRRPSCKTQKRAPRALKVGVKKPQTFNAYAIVKHPLSSESAIKTIEDHNTLVFIVDRRAKKPTIKKACEELYKIKVRRVNTLMRPDGEKKAYVTLAADQEALEVASRIGIM